MPRMISEQEKQQRRESARRVRLQAALEGQGVPPVSAAKLVQHDGALRAHNSLRRAVANRALREALGPVGVEAFSHIVKLLKP